MSRPEAEVIPDDGLGNSPFGKELDKEGLREMRDQGIERKNLMAVIDG